MGEGDRGRLFLDSGSSFGIEHFVLPGGLLAVVMGPIPM